MIRLKPVLVFAVFALAGLPSQAMGEGIDQLYTKPGGEKSWGQQALEYIGIGAGSTRSYAFVVGISDYKGGFEPLQTKSDPIRMKNLLLHIAGFDEVHLLTDEKVTQDRVRQLMEVEFPQRADANDRFLFYWSGHGIARPGNKGVSGYLSLSASGRKEFHTMVTMDDIERWSRLSDAKQVLFLLDSCFSGLAGISTKSDRDDLDISQINRPSSHLIAAGTANEQAIVGDKWGGSLFTHALIEGLSGDADAGSAICY